MLGIELLQAETPPNTRRPPFGFIDAALFSPD